MSDWKERRFVAGEGEWNEEADAIRVGSGSAWFPGGPAGVLHPGAPYGSGAGACHVWGYERLFSGHGGFEGDLFRGALQNPGPPLPIVYSWTFHLNS